MATIQCRTSLQSGQHLLLVLLLASCASAPNVDRILEDGDCGSVPDIERLATTISDHGTQVSFRWRGTRFSGVVQTGTQRPALDASQKANQAGEWERRFPGISATTTVPGSYLGFPAAIHPRAGVLAAAVFEDRYPASGNPGVALAIVDLKTAGTQLVGAKRRVHSVAWSPKGDYVAAVEVAPTSGMSGWRDVFGLFSPPATPQFDVYTTIYSASGLAACSRRVVGRVPAPAPALAWE